MAGKHSPGASRSSQHGASQSSHKNPASEETSQTQRPRSVDLNVLEDLRCLGGRADPNSLAEVIDLFLIDTVVRIEEVAKAIREKSSRGLEAAAHSLKGSSSNLGVEVISSYCSELLDYAQESNFAAAALLLEPLRAEFNRVKVILEREKHRTKPT